MRITIFEQDYSDINTIHNSIERLAKFKEYTIYQVLTTRKVQSILDYLESYVADSYFISIRPDQPETFDLAKHVRQQNPSTQIVLIIEEQTAEIQGRKSVHPMLLRKIQKRHYNVMLRKLLRQITNNT